MLALATAGLLFLGAPARAQPLPSRATLLAEAQANSHAIAFTRDGARLAFVHEGRLAFLRGDALSVEPALPGGRVVASQGFVPLLAASHGELVVVRGQPFDAATGRELVLPPPAAPESQGGCSDPNFSASGTRASISCLGDLDATFILDTATGKRIGAVASLKGAGQPEGGRITPSGNFVFVTERGRGVFIGVRTRVRSVDFGSHAVRSPHDRFVFMHPGEQKAWLGRDDDGPILPPRLVDTQAGRPVYALPAWVETVTFSPTDRLFVARAHSASESFSAALAHPDPHRDILVYATSSSVPVVDIPFPIDEVDDVAFTQDDTRLAVLTKHGRVRLYALE